MTDPPLTVGTAGHIDHGKTALVRALTGVDTDRLPEEHRRGISIDLGYAPLRLPRGRRVSMVDVPGHERFVRTMVAGASGVDLFLLVVAADDGVMRQTVEHMDVLKALNVPRGVVAITKSDLVNPREAAADVSELLAPWAHAEVIACSARTGNGVADVAAALERAASAVSSRSANGGDAVLHVDRSFTVRGAGTVVTGTLWSGHVSRGSHLAVLPTGITVRVRSIQVHGELVESAAAGQRVALNLVGVAVGDVKRGDVVATPSALSASHILDAQLTVRPTSGSFRAMIHHGTRETPGQLVPLGADWWQLRVARPLLARAGDRLVVRSIAPPDTLGGGAIVDPHARHHGSRPRVVQRLEGSRVGEVGQVVAPSDDDARTKDDSRNPLSLGPAALTLEQHLRGAGYEPPSDVDLGESAAELPALISAGRVVRIGRSMHIHADAIAEVRERVTAILEAEGQITAARLRDELNTSRKYAVALLEHLDATRVTLRSADGVRTPRKRR